MNEILMIMTAGLWVNSAITLHSPHVPPAGAWIFFGIALFGTMVIAGTY